MPLNLDFKQFSSVKKEENKPRIRLKPPPKTCDEWLTSSSGAGHLVSADGTFFIPSKEGEVVQWPNHPLHLDYLVAAPLGSVSEVEKDSRAVTKTARKHTTPGDTILGSLKEIEEDLRKHAPWNNSLLDDIKKRLGLLSSSIDISADSFVEDDQYTRSSKESAVGGLVNVSGTAFMTELSEELLSKRKMSLSATGKKTAGDKWKNTEGKTKVDGTSAETITFPELDNGPVLVPLPGNLDVLAILNLVSNAADIPTRLIKSWKRIFFCSESSSIIQNAFWWMWLDYFKPRKWIQTLLFNQIADDFVSILNKMDGMYKYKDEIFMRLPVYLTQALYSIFCHAFPDSNQELNSSEFLDYLCNTISEWIIGVKSAPNQWKQWPRHFLNPHFLSLRSKREATWSAEHKNIFTEKEMMSLSQHLSQSLMSKLSSESIGSKINGTTVGTTVGRSLPSGKDSAHELDRLESSIFSLSKLETGPIFECVRFSVYGCSPLLQHYLYCHHIVDSKKAKGMAVARTQIKEFPVRGLTYKQLLSGHAKKTQKLYQDYKTQMAQTDRDIAAVRSKHQANIRKREKQYQRLLQHRHEVARLAEELVASRADGIIPRALRHSESDSCLEIAKPHS